MTDQCYQPDDFERLLELPEDHEERRHLATCAACRTEFALYSSFMSRDNVPAGADLADANARLGDFLAREIADGGTAVEAESAPTVGRSWDVRRWSPMLVAACLVCVVIFVKSSDDSGIVSPSGVVRDLSSGVPVLETTEAVTTEGFVLSWNGPSDADHYQVIVVDVTMAEIARLDGELAGEYWLRRQDHSWLGNPGPFLWYVVALRDGDEIARSTVRVLESGP